MSKIKKIIVH